MSSTHGGQLDRQMGPAAPSCVLLRLLLREHGADASIVCCMNAPGGDNSARGHRDGRVVTDEHADPARLFLYSGSQLRGGHFRFLFSTGIWEWSSELAALHGYPAEPKTLTTDAVLKHRHPDDLAEVTRAVDTSARIGAPFRSRHRIVDLDGSTHHVLVIGDSLRDADGVVIGTGGVYVDLHEVRTDAIQSEVITRVTDFETSRAVIEQAKGILMFAYSLTDQQAFDLIVWRSQQTNIKVRDLARVITERVPREIDLIEYNSARFGHILLYPHDPQPPTTLTDRSTSRPAPGPAFADPDGNHRAR